MTDRGQAELYILDSSWYTTLRSRMTEATKVKIRRRLAEAKNDDDQLSSGEWRVRFTGKEIFRHIRSQIYDSSDRRATSAELDSDVAKAVARWQFDHKAVPDEIRELLVALRQRVGIQ